MTRWARALFQLAFASIALLGCLRDPDTVERDLRNQIQQELPIGTDKSQVISFLRRHNIGEFVYGEKTRTIYAKIRDVARWRLEFATEIRLKFYFDENEKFTSYEAEQVLIGF